MACAYLFLDSTRKEKINALADKLKVSPIDAAIIYTIGAINAAKRRGTAKNYKEALEALENEQVGDRGNRIVRTINADYIANTVAKIEMINYGNNIIPDYYRSFDNGKTWEAHYPTSRKKPNLAGKAISKIIGKIQGTFYTEWENQQDELDPTRIYDKKVLNTKLVRIDKNLMLVFTEYESRLSPMSKRRLYELVTGTESAAYLTSRLGQNDPKTKKKAWSAVYLFQNFPYRDRLKCVDFINLVRRYIQPKK